MTSRKLHQIVSPDAKIKINSKVEVADKPEVKGKAIPGIKKYY
jgi:ATP-binding protein involved in chromosome partitioning